MKFVTVKESHYAADLQILKSRLESEGIACFVEGELTSQLLRGLLIIPFFQETRIMNKMQATNIFE